MASQYFSLRWNNHPANLVSTFSGLYSSETLVDVTLAAEGKHIQAHKMLLSACSEYFQVSLASPRARREPEARRGFGRCSSCFASLNDYRSEIDSAP
jgi:hypothetical protein